MSQVKRLRFHLAYVEAYEGEGWRKASREKLKPSKELATANKKILAGKRAVVDTLAELQQLHQGHTQYPYLAGGGGIVELLPEDIYCSRCGSTDADEDNDILICDNEGCQRAYHQKCQTPWLATTDIPVGNELWYCEVCLAIFNSLKAINYAFGTTYETIPEVFPELLEEEEQEEQRDEATRGASGGGVFSGAGGEEEDGDEDDDEDFVDEDGANDEDDGESGSEDSSDEDDAGRAESHGGDDVEPRDDDDEISDQELKYLRKSDVIDPNRYERVDIHPRVACMYTIPMVGIFCVDVCLYWFVGVCSRSTRSRSTQSKTQTTNTKRPQQADASLLGQKAAKVNPETGNVVFGVVVEEAVNDDDDDESSEPQWQVIYYNDTMEMLTREGVHAAITCAREHENAGRVAMHDGNDRRDEHDPRLILQGKRKRTQVNYRELNAMMFAGKEDSDDEAYADDEDEQRRQRDRDTAVAADDRDNDHVDAIDRDDDYRPEPKKKTTAAKKKQQQEESSTTTTTTEGRSRRERKRVDYNALNEGLLSY